MQVLTTVSRFLTEEDSQVALPVARRSAPAFGDLADSISADAGCQRGRHAAGEPGLRQRRSAGQVAFATTVDSPYGSTTMAVWDLSADGGAAQNQVQCVLWSTLLGPGRASTALDLGAGAQLQPCEPQVVVTRSTERAAAAPRPGRHPAVAGLTPGGVAQEIRGISQVSHWRGRDRAIAANRSDYA